MIVKLNTKVDGLNIAVMLDKDVENVIVPDKSAPYCAFRFRAEIRKGDVIQQPVTQFVVVHAINGEDGVHPALELACAAVSRFNTRVARMTGIRGWFEKRRAAELLYIDTLEAIASAADSCAWKLRNYSRISGVLHICDDDVKALVAKTSK